MNAFAALNNSNYLFTIGTDKNICDGDSVQISSPLYTSYLWSTGDTTQSIYFDTTALNINVTVVNTSGCVALSDTIDVVWKPL
ncbi:MAG: hypothetical protein JKX98_05140, partial [Alcanivoracaceae bacterium]|nr:hypothetical protein [Alcanivoracaceae bacterium]